ncbi:MAG TPA: hypothetical protein VFC39_09895 [Acidobacteriaceae bacterium]|nr:hypothetical protein [Acidobacteriaceae bacterium]
MMRAVRNAILAMMVLTTAAVAHAQASDVPSADAGPSVTGNDRGRKLIALMVQALGGDAWINRKDWTIEGHAATFYKGNPNEGVIAYEEFHRAQPSFAERIEIITKIGVFIPTAKRDIVQVWTPDDGYEITYKGKKELPKIDVADFERRRAHSVESVVTDWLKRPGVEVVYEGTSIVERHLADKVTVLSPDNDAVTLELDETTHLPLAREFEYRDAVYKDHDDDREEYDDYHMQDGFMTALVTTRYRNGDMVSQRYYTKVTYNKDLSPALFDPDKLLEKHK